MTRWWLWLGIGGCAGSGGGTGPGDPPVGADPDIVYTEPNRSVIPLFEWTQIEHEGFSVYHYVPEDPVGVVWIFHGTNGGLSSVNQTEWIAIYNLLVQRDIALVAAVSADRKDGQWSLDSTDPETNPDLGRLSRLWDELIDDTLLGESTPMAGLAFSRGCSFAILFGDVSASAGKDVRAYSLHQGGSGSGPIYPRPTIWFSAENDETGQTPDRYDPVAESCSTILGAPCPHEVFLEEALDPTRFARIPSFDQDQSRLMFDELIQFGIVDADGIRSFDLVDLEATLSGYERNSLYSSPSLVSTQLRVVWATHRMSGGLAAVETAFLAEALR